MEWLEELDDEEIEQLLDLDNKLVYEHCGLDTLKSLMANLPSMRLYISKRPVERAQKLYISKHFNGRNHKQLAIRLGCSEQFVYDTLKQQNAPKEPDNEPDLFNVE